MSPGDLPGIGGLVVALICGWFTYRSQREKDQITRGISAIEGFDRLAEDLRSDLSTCRGELKTTRAELLADERTIHEQDFKITEQQHEIEKLQGRIAVLEAGET